MSSEDGLAILNLVLREVQELSWEYAAKIALEMVFWLRHKDFPVKQKLSKPVMLQIAMRYMVCLPVFETEDKVPNE